MTDDDRMFVEAIRPVPDSCQNCPDQGWYAVQNRRTGEPEQEQCEFCCINPNSVFNRPGTILRFLSIIESLESRIKELETQIKDRSEFGVGK